MRLLVTNDDGIEAPGLHALARAIATPATTSWSPRRSATSAATGAAIGNLEPGATSGPSPTSCPTSPASPRSASTARRRWRSWPPASAASATPPTLIVSGINPGNNTGRAVLHSGTVGRRAHRGQLRVLGGRGQHRLVRRRRHWDDGAAPYAVAAVEWVASAPTNDGPQPQRARPCRSAEVEGARWAELAPFGTVRVPVGEPARAGSRSSCARPARSSRRTPTPPSSRPATRPSRLLTGIRAADREPVAEAIERCRRP